MSIGEWIALGGLALTIIGLFAGGVWTLALLVFDVRAIRLDLAEYVGADKEDKRNIWDKLRSHGKEISALGKEHANLHSRVTVLEKDK